LFFLPPLSLSGYNFHFLWTECLILLYKKVNLRKPLDFGLQTVSRSLSNWRHIYFIWTFIIFSCRLPSMAIYRNKKGFDWICKWKRERTEKNHEHIKTCPVLFFPPAFPSQKDSISIRDEEVWKRRYLTILVASVCPNDPS
jgi:hypothetical protein